ncbi:site-specific DNA-methyltransferase [Candidatus Dojkabacteria bacterium]|nr:site-specific DNA-methyltransferase [Candidatus Dojkabacteria bacterium]
METNTIIQGDCLDVMKDIPDKSIDMILTSPPYNLGNTHHTGGIRHKAYDDNMLEQDYQKWQIAVLKECHRILKDTGSLIYNHKNRIKDGVQITPYEWILKTPFIVKQEIVWFNRSQNFDKIRFYPMTERVYWLAKSPKTKLFNAINHHDLFDTKEWKAVGTKGEHTRAFPEKMVEDILKCFPDAEVVLDPFAGSGTTGVACKKLGRNFILIEKEPEYVKIAQDRIKSISNPLF